MVTSLADIASWVQVTQMNVCLCKRKLFEYIKNFALQYEKEDGLAPRAEE